MFQSNKSVICGLFLGLVLHASSEVETRLLSKDQPGPYRPWSREYRQFDRDDLHGMTAEKLAKMSLDDPLLRHAYIYVFLQNVRELDTLEPEQAVALEDMRRRRDSITPLLLELARQNQETGFEGALLDGIAEVGNIDLDPYLEYARKLLRERTQTMNYSLAQCASMLLANHGSKQDLALLEQVVAERPYVSRGVSEELKVLQARLNKTKPETRPVMRDKPPASGATTGGNMSVASTSVANSRDKASTMSWILWVLCGIVLIGMFWKLLKKGVKQE